VHSEEDVLEQVHSEEDVQKQVHSEDVQEQVHSEEDKHSKEDRTASLESSSDEDYVDDTKEMKTELKKVHEENAVLIEKQKWISEVMEDIGCCVDKMVEKIGLTVDTKDCNHCGYVELKKKLRAVDKHLDANPVIMKLEKVVKEMKESCKSAYLPATGEVDEEDLDTVFRKCLSIKDIEDKLSELEYVKEQVQCIVCNKKAGTYSTEHEDDFRGRTQPPHFRDLKKVLKRHLTSEGHRIVIKQNSAQEKLDEKKFSREKKIGLVLGDVAFYILKNGRPYTDFSLLVGILARAGVDVGDLNHSSKFVEQWGLFCAAEIQMFVCLCFFQLSYFLYSRYSS
jgi:hypothetical protein